MLRNLPLIPLSGASYDATYNMPSKHDGLVCYDIDTAIKYSRLSTIVSSTHKSDCERSQMRTKGGGPATLGAKVEIGGPVDD